MMHHEPIAYATAVPVDSKCDASSVFLDDSRSFVEDETGDFFNRTQLAERSSKDFCEHFEKHCNKIFYL